MKKQITPFGKLLRKVRIELDTSTNEMAKELDVTAAFLSQLELGKRRVSTELLARLEDYFGKYDLYEDLPELYYTVDGLNGRVSVEGLSYEHQRIVSKLAKWHLDREQIEAIDQFLRPIDGHIEFSCTPNLMRDVSCERKALQAIYEGIAFPAGVPKEGAVALKIENAADGGIILKRADGKEI